MRLSLFSRLVLGYLVVFVLVIAVSVYVIIELREFDAITRSILEYDNRALDYEKKLADALLSQVRYERKFTITKDETLYKQFLRFKEDFERYYQQALAVADPQAKQHLAEIKRRYERYLDIFGKEAVHLRTGQSYPQAWYKAEKDKISDEVLGLLEKWKARREEETYRKIRRLADSGTLAQREALRISGVVLGFILLLSFLITRSITRPISVLKNKTHEIAQGRFSADLQISSPPEIGQLAAAFNSMCERLNKLDRMKTDFYASMSHELRTPLTSIKEGTGLLLDGVGGETTEKQRKLLSILAEESNRLIALVNSLLDLSKMEAGMMPYSFEKTSLAPLIKKAVGEITPLVEAKGIKLDTEIAEELPPVKVDPERILQVLRNLIGNAVKFTPKAGQVKVAARSVNGTVEVAVRDTGPGIPPESLPTIFDKFRQGSSNGGASENGTGLGLAIAKHIVTFHGGKIWAENHAEQGSSFIFVLPR
ncbi:MAG TPA: HAMP domain-containing sensor histidine kinase [Candidatus Eisenbacteria bacterium]|nr:HAMP domain-containing sensor histidine kinase [Candidatus Eisenbacteria bacterium]